MKNTAASKNSIFLLLPLYTVIFIGFVGYSLMITVFTPLLLHGNSGLLSATASLSQRTIVLGVLLALYPFGQFFGSPILGALSDRFGRKPVLMVSLCAGLLCYMLIAVALSMQSLALLMLSLLLAGLAEANIVIAQSAIADIANEADRGRLFGYINLSASSAYIIGPLIGGKLAGWYNNATAFWGVCVLLLVTIVWTLKVFRETKLFAEMQSISYLRMFTNLLSIFTDRRIRIFYLLNFLFYLAIFGFFRCYPMYLVDAFHMNVSRMSEFIAWVSVPLILANFGLIGFLSRRFPPRILMVVSGFAVGVFMIVLIIPHAVNALWITLFLAALATAVCLPISAALLSGLVGKAEQGSVMGNNQAIAVSAEALSGLVGGLLAAIAVKLPLIILAIVAITASVIMLTSADSK